MPLLQNFGLTVLSEDAHELKFERDGQAATAFIEEFNALGPGGRPIARMPGANLLGEQLNLAPGDGEFHPAEAHYTLRVVPK